MRINNNIMAFNANRNLGTSNNMLGKSLEKLSSGYRINRAGDDAAGLVISQKLRAEIGGLKQATRNAQDGISYVQTAEGALGEVHNMLGRMRDLAVQAANDTNDTNARNAIQSEMNALGDEIVRIGADTTFAGAPIFAAGTINLQVGSEGDSGGQIAVTSENLAASESRIRDTDMAAEMVNFTKAQILQQAGTAMLGQANSVPQSVLSLLQ